MISIDLSKVSSFRPLVYLLALIPGLFFMSSVALGNAALAQFALTRVKAVYPFPTYGLTLILIAAAFIIGHAIIMLSWMIDMLLRALYRVLRYLVINLVQKVTSSQRFIKWFAGLQGNPPKPPLLARPIGKLMAFCAGMPNSPEETEAIWDCLVAATERLLERRYGITRLRASGRHRGTWDIWCTVLGNPVRPLVESQFVGRTLCALGLAGFLAIALAPQLENQWFVALSFIFAFSGLWASFVAFFRWRNPAWRNAIRLQSVLQELKEWSNTEADRHETQKEAAITIKNETP